MKRLPILCMTALMLLAACGNGGSSTVGTYEQEETKSSENHESESHGGGAHEEAETNKTHAPKVEGDTTHVEADDSRKAGTTEAEDKH